jgi:hypothetical protein
MRAIRIAAVAWVMLATPAVMAGEPLTTKGTRMYSQDLALLQKHVKAIVLSDQTGRAQVAIAPEYQGRVMTSTARGPEGESLGWINSELIASGKTLPHMNPYGGEDRFWLGPEGGQFALFFKGGTPYDLEHWQTPPLIDTEPFEVASYNAHEVVFRREAALTNRAGFTFQLKIDRIVRLLERDETARMLEIDLPAGVDVAAYQTKNRLTNAGKEPWKKTTGLPSIWILGMYPPSPGATVVIPFKSGDASALGPAVNDAYFGKVPADRLIVGDGVLFFRADGQRRSKIGIPPRRAKPVGGSYDPARRMLTIVQFTPSEGTTDYVNSMWEEQKAPFGGDVVNSYNDGPASPGAKPLGPFYELESSSPALALNPGEVYTHVHRTIHLQGSDADLDPIARKTLGVGIAEIKAKFGG